jgi:hypothetical protein
MLSQNLLGEPGERIFTKYGLLKTTLIFGTQILAVK